MFKDLFGYDFIAKEVLSRTKDKVSEYRELMETFPETAKDILDKVKRFKFEIDIEDKDVKGLTTELERSSGNLALGMIIAALIIGSSMIMQLEKGKYLYIAGFILSSILGLWLVHRTIFIKMKR